MLLRRYANIEHIMSLDIDVFFDFIKLAKEKEREERHFSQWVSMLPFMSMKQLEYISFQEYKDKVTGANIDTRPTAVILREIEELHGRRVEK